jgi:hypothetical protein
LPADLDTQLAELIRHVLGPKGRKEAYFWRSLHSGASFDDANFWISTRNSNTGKEENKGNKPVFHMGIWHPYIPMGIYQGTYIPYPVAKFCLAPLYPFMLSAW